MLERQLESPTGGPVVVLRRTWPAWGRGRRPLSAGFSGRLSKRPCPDLPPGPLPSPHCRQGCWEASFTFSPLYGSSAFVKRLSAIPLAFHPSPLP